MRTLLLPVFALVALATSAQARLTAADHLRAFATTMSRAESYRVDVTVLRTQRSTGRVVGTEKARAFKQGGLFRTEMGEHVALVTKERLVLVDPQSRTIVVRDRGHQPTAAPTADPLGDWSRMFDDDRSGAAGWRIVRSTQHEVVLAGPDGAAPFSDLRITLRTADHLPVRIEYDMAGDGDLPFDHVRLDYVDVQVNCKLPADTFSEKRFIRLDGRKAVPAPAYQGMEIQYVPGS